MNKLAGVALVVQELNGARTVLMVTNRKYGGWCLPGGKVEDKDFELVPKLCVGQDRDRFAARVAAHRELREETGLSQINLDWLFEARSVTSERMVHVFHVLRAKGPIDMHAEPGTHARWFSWLAWKASPFEQFYREHFPHGIERLAPAILF